MKKYFLGILVLTLLTAFGQINSQTKNDSDNKNMSDTLKTENDSLTIAILETNMGKIEIELFPQYAPKTVENFTGLIEKGYYNGVIFHRVIDKFMIQGGDPTGTGRGGQSLWGGKFADEFNSHLKFDEPGLLAMANSGPNTNGSQFFITLVSTEWLNNHHTIFGKVVLGMDVVEKIGKVKTTQPMNRPVEDVVITKASVEKRAK